MPARCSFCKVRESLDSYVRTNKRNPATISRTCSGCLLPHAPASCSRRVALLSHLQACHRTVKARRWHRRCCCPWPYSCYWTSEARKMIARCMRHSRRKYEKREKWAHGTLQATHLDISFISESAWELLYNSSVSATEFAPAQLRLRPRRAQGGESSALEFKVAELFDLPWGPIPDFEPWTFCARKVSSHRKPHMRDELAKRGGRLWHGSTPCQRQRHSWQPDF
jgi:hypothetical protein